MINTPERINAPTTSHLHRAIKEACTFLETAVKEKRIKGYGICTTTIAFDDIHGCVGEGFSMFQAPGNVYEKTRRRIDRKGVKMVVNRPLMAMKADKRIRLLSTSLVSGDKHELMIELSDLMQALGDMESDFISILEENQVKGDFEWANVCT